MRGLEKARQKRAGGPRRPRVVLGKTPDDADTVMFSRFNLAIISSEFGVK